MSKNKGNAVPTLPSAPSAPASSAPAEVAAEPKKTPKMSLAQAEALVKAGIITAENLERMKKENLVTSGDGGGEDIFVQLGKAGVPKADADALKAALAKVNESLWKDAKTFIGTAVPHKFSFTADDKKTYSYEAPAELETALWIKHFDPSAKANRAAAIAKK
jgi:hypothetical protein